MRMSPILLLACTLASPAPGGAQQASEPARVPDSILGVRIGMRSEEVSAKLSPLGTVGGRATRDGGRKEAWTLRETDFTSLAVKTNERRRVVWVTGFLRPGKEMPFSALGNLGSATAATDLQAVWDVASPEGGYRLVAKGHQGKARVVSLVSQPVPAPQ